MTRETRVCVLGVDGGASKTAAVLMDRDGRVLGRGQSGAANHHHVGVEGARRALRTAMEAAVEQAGISWDRIGAITWALAGVDRPQEYHLFTALAAAMVPDIPVRVENDAVAALVGGTGGRYGVVLIAGTGMIAYGEDGRGNRARAGGWGHLLEHGSAYDLARTALQAIADAADGTDLHTHLTARVLQALNLADPVDLLGWVYTPGRQVAEIAALAPLVLAEAEAGDPVALDVVARAADALARAVDAVARRLNLGAQPFPLVLAGGLLTAGDFYRQVVTQAIQTRTPHARPCRPRADAAVGAALLALETLGHALDARLDVSTPDADVWTTEEVNVLSRDLDLRTSLEVVGLMHVEDRRAVEAVRSVLPAIARAVDAIAARMRRGGRLIYVGAGTSGRLGVLDASECPPTFDTSPGRVAGLIAGGERALVSSQEAAEDDPDAGRRDVAGTKVGPRDSVVGITASGRTAYVIGAVEEARRRGALTLALVCNLPAPLADVADHVIAPLVGPEVIAGSTRLKAGTAQKLVLNMLSTGVMVRLGKTYGNLMVDVRPENVKLQARGRRIVAQACGISEEEAGEVLAASGGDVKVAIVSTLAGCPPEVARAHLAERGGVVRAALAALGRGNGQVPPTGLSTRENGGEIT